MKNRLATLYRIKNKYSPARTEVRSTGGSYFTQASSSGKQIDATNALEIDTVLACVRVLAESVASLPLDLYIRNEAQSTVAKAKEEELFWILKERPNDEMTSYELRLWMMVDCILRGNGYAQVIRSGRGVLELWPLKASKVKPKRTKSGKLVYEYPMENGKDIALEADEVLHIKAFSYGGLIGLSLIELQKDLLGAAKSSEDYAAEFFANGSAPSGLLSIPEELSDKAYERLQREWQDAYTGEGNRHKAPILEGGAKFEPTMLNHEETQLLETRKFSRSGIAGVLRVPAHMINDLEKATFSNIEHQDLGFLKHSLRPWLTNWEQRLKLTLIDKSQRETHYFKHNTNDLLRGDSKARSEAYSSLVQNGVYSPNDVRRKEEENPYDGGDEYLINGTLRPVKMAGREYEMTPEEKNLLK